ncbi:MAG: glycosyltransferase [Nanobdellota archaeon]
MKPTIDVITLHMPERHDTLEDCVQSVDLQKGDFDMSYYIYVDSEGRDTEVSELQKLQDNYGFNLCCVSTMPEGIPKYQRGVFIRNFALRRSNSDYLLWLDDDNWLDPEHIESLVDTLNSENTELAYSARKVVTKDKKPFLLNKNPWQKEDGMRHMEILYNEGICSPHSNLMYDGPFTEEFDGYYGTIDMGEWLFPVNLIKSIGIPYPNGWKYGEDDLLLGFFVRNAFSMASTGMYTLNYRIGGTTS